MHLAKGLEFHAVALMARDKNVIPNDERIQAITAESELADGAATKRHLLEGGHTRAPGSPPDHQRHHPL
ncbi:MAG: hypothetical protein ACK41W_03395 [Cyanobacteriota bacterium]|jgi:superfamily I DNA/RNA helicase